MRAIPTTSPRRRPRQARAQATVDAIVKATARVLVEEGYDRASTNRIAHAVFPAPYRRRLRRALAGAPGRTRAAVFGGT